MFGLCFACVLLHTFRCAFNYPLAWHVPHNTLFYLPQGSGWCSWVEGHQRWKGGFMLCVSIDYLQLQSSFADPVLQDFACEILAHKGITFDEHLGAMQPHDMLRSGAHCCSELVPVAQLQLWDDFPLTEFAAWVFWARFHGRWRVCGVLQLGNCWTWGVQHMGCAIQTGH